MNLIVAADENWGIGRDGALLARIPEDMAFFREKTLGKAVVMGRATLVSLPGRRPLEGRINIVMSRDPGFRVGGALVCSSVGDVARVAGMCAPGDVFVIGGQSVYEQLLHLCSTAYVTKFWAAPPPQGLDSPPPQGLDRAPPPRSHAQTPALAQAQPQALADRFFPDLDCAPGWELVGRTQAKRHGVVEYCFCVYSAIGNKNNFEKP
jgi:dihydrofolate reductase